MDVTCDAVTSRGSPSPLLASSPNVPGGAPSSGGSAPCLKLLLSRRGDAGAWTGPSVPLTSLVMLSSPSSSDASVSESDISASDSSMRSICLDLRLVPFGPRHDSPVWKQCTGCRQLRHMRT